MTTKTRHEVWLINYPRFQHQLGFLERKRHSDFTDRIVIEGEREGLKSIRQMMSGERGVSG